MTGPPEHRKEPQKVTIRRRKLLPQDTINRHLPEQNNPVVNSNEITMVTKQPVAAEDHQRPRANPIAAGPVLMTVQKEAMAVNHRVRKESTNQGKVRDILTTAQKAVSAAARRKASNHAALLIRGARLMMINPREVSAANHPAKNGHILKRLPIQAGQVLMIAPKEVLTANHPKKEISNQGARHIQAGPGLTISPKEVLIANHPAKKEILTREDRHIRADQHPMTGPKETLIANHPAKKENSNQEAHHTRAVQVLTISPREALVVIKNSAAPIAIGAADLKNAMRLLLSVNRKIHPIINQNLSAAPKNG